MIRISPIPPLVHKASNKLLNEWLVIIPKPTVEYLLLNMDNYSHHPASPK
jgi:hypothetical protein